MKTKFKLISAAIAVLMSINATAQEEPVVELNKSQISMKFQSILPFKVESISEAPISGMYQVATERGIFYVTKNGENLINGSVHDFEDGLDNLTAKANAEIAADVMNRLKPTFLTYKAPNETHEVLVFFDTSCGYCRKLHNEVSQLNAMGITVHYAMYPRNGIMQRNSTSQHTQSYLSMQSIVCADKPTQALDMEMRGTQPEPKVCDNAIEEHHSLGERLGVSGTPMIYDFSGEQITAGYLPAKQLVNVIKRGE